MNIRVLAGRLRLPAWTTTADFLEYIRKRWNGRPLNDDNTRRVFLIAGDDLTYGLNIYLKDQRAYYQLIEDANTRRARIKLSQTDNIMEFNYFYLRHDTGAYAMSHYTGCCTGMGDFERVLRKLFNHYTDDCGAREDNSGRRRLKKKGRAKFSRLCTEESWEDRVRDLESLNEITILEESSDDVCVEIVRASESAFTPSRIRSKRTTYTLQSTRPRDRVVEGLRAMYRKLRPKRASVAGKSASGDSVTVRIGEDAQVFDRLDYNSIVEQIDFDSFHRSTLMRQMLQFKDNAIMRAKLP